MVLCGRHRFPQSFIILEVTHQDAQAVQVRMLWRDDLKNGLPNDHKYPNEHACKGSIHICKMYLLLWLIWWFPTFPRIPYNNIQRNGLYFLHSTVHFMNSWTERGSNEVQQIYPWHKIKHILCGCNAFWSCEGAALFSSMTNFSLHVEWWSEMVNLGFDTEWHQNLMVTGHVLDSENYIYFANYP